MICKPEFTRDLYLRARKIKLVLMDVDGVLTNGEIIYDTDSTEIKIYNAHDGLGITMARLAGLKTGIISARESAAIRYRAAELKFDFLYLGHFNKLNSYLNLKKEMKFQDEEICFIGDDLPDIAVLKAVGLPVAVANATPLVKQATPFHTLRAGGKGAVREVIEYLLETQGKLEQVIKNIIEQKTTG